MMKAIKAIVVSVAMLGCLISTDGAIAERLRTYTHPAYAWSISYPDGWYLDASNPDFIKLEPAFPNTALVGIQTHLVRLTSLDELVVYLTEYSRHLLGKQGLNVIEVYHKPLILKDGTIAVDQLVELGPGGKSRRLFVLVGNRAFIIDAETRLEDWPRYSVQFDKIIRSFTLKRR